MGSRTVHLTIFQHISSWRQIVLIIKNDSSSCIKKEKTCSYTGTTRGTDGHTERQRRKQHIHNPVKVARNETVAVTFTVVSQGLI